MGSTPKGTRPATAAETRERIKQANIVFNQAVEDAGIAPTWVIINLQMSAEREHALALAQQHPAFFLLGARLQRRIRTGNKPAMDTFVRKLISALAVKHGLAPLSLHVSKDVWRERVDQLAALLNQPAP